jgi:thiol-disulfide isomerase/thioredoxin
MVAAAMVCGVSTVRAGDDAPGAGAVPRYRLEPGMELSYKGSSTFQYQNGSHGTESEAVARVVGRNADGSVRVVMREGTRFLQTSSDQAPREKPAMEYNVGRFDLYPDGRIGDGAEVGYRINPATYFPPLPSDRAQGESGWAGAIVGESAQDPCRYSGLKAEPDGWMFEGQRIGPFQVIYGMKSDSTYHFDSGRGVIRRVDSQTAQDYGFKGTGTGTLELTGIATGDAAAIEALAKASDAYFAATSAYDKASEAAMRAESEEAAKAALTAAKADLQKARDAIDQPMLREQLDEQLAQHDRMASYAVEDATRRAGIVGKPAADWTLDGLDDKPHSLADYKGKVVVLDFWYRGCGWCVKAMPQMNELAEQFRDRPVAILGMNTDAKVDDAKFVADAMGLKYGTLTQAKAMPEKYGVQGFPTLVIIGPDGIVRDLHVGYSASLRETVGKVIEGLLPPG